MIDIQVEYHSGIPVYKQIIASIVTAIELGELQSGDKLPSIRELSSQLNINPNTTAKVYRELELTGMIESQTGRGSFVLPQAEKIISEQEKATHLQQLVNKLLTEARKFHISRDDVLHYLQEIK